MELDEIKKQKRRGDIIQAAEILNLTTCNVRQALRRPNSIHHLAVLKALEFTIKTRESILGHIKKNLTMNSH